MVVSIASGLFFHYADSQWFLYKYIVGINVYTMWIYYLDKEFSKNNIWRISEKSLHQPIHLGGWIGAILGRQLFDHKTKKESFGEQFYRNIMINISAICVICAVYFYGNEIYSWIEELLSDADES